MNSNYDITLTPIDTTGTLCSAVVTSYPPNAGYFNYKVNRVTVSNGTTTITDVTSTVPVYWRVYYYE